MPGDRGDRARDWAVLEGVLRQHRSRPADPARGRGQRSVERVAEDRDGSARLRVRELEGFQIDSPDTEDGDVVVDVEDDHFGPGGSKRPGRRRIVSCSPATTWAAVTMRFLPATQPLPSMPTPQAVPR